jgi:DNA replication protein DnaC
MPEENCSICGGTGWKIVERAGLSGAERCECVPLNRARNLKESAKIPPNYQESSFDNFIVPDNNPTARRDLGTVLMQVRSFVREFPKGEPPGLLLVGETGTGKTYLAVAALKALLDKGHEGVFFDYQNLINRIRAGWDAASGTSDREAYQTALDTDILLLDDLGAHRTVEWVEDTLTSILTHRCNHRKPLIATTNLADPDVTGPVVAYTAAGGVEVHKKTLAEMIGMRARSRLFEMCRVVRMPAVADYRVQHGRIVKL